jgi:hypothetical protein
MAAFLDLCRFSPTLGGTTDWIYSSAVTGCQSPTAAGAVNGRPYKYRAESANLSQWEIGEGAYNSGTGTFARTTVLFNSSGTTAKINFTLVPQVAIVALKEDLISIEEANAFTAAQQAQVRSNIGMADGHIPGEPSNGAAASGEIGESGATSVAAANFATSNTPQNVTSLLVPAGDFEIMAVILYGGAGATTSTDWTSIISSTSTPSVSAGNAITGIAYHTRRPSGADVAELQSHIPWRVSNASPTTYYLHASAVFATSTYAYQGVMRYRRAR